MKIAILSIVRSIVYSIVIFVPILACAQYKLTIIGHAPLLNNGTEIMVKQFAPYRLRNLNKPHTTKVKDHQFTFVLDVDGAESYYLGVGKNGYRMFLEPGQAGINIADSTLKNASVTGSPANIDYNKFYNDDSPNELNSEYSKSQDDYRQYQTIKNYDTVLANIKRKKMDSLRLLVQKQSLNSCLTWIKQHPNSLINTNILYDQLLYVTPYISEDEVKQVYQSMPAAIVGNVWGKELRYHIDSLFIGGKAPDFSLPDTSGRQKSLKDFEGKYVLIDFWASWCVPCRNQNPDLVKIMKKFENRNFTILGVSVDDERNNWIDAIRQDRLCWTQLSSLNGRQNPVAIKYYANTYPFNYLIAPDGKIAAKNIGIKELNTKLNALIK